MIEQQHRALAGHRTLRAKFAHRLQVRVKAFVDTINRYAHLVGGCRMAKSPQRGVVDANLRSFAVPNLYVTDGSVLPTQGSANPALTIMALAARAADHLSSADRGWAP